MRFEWDQTKNLSNQQKHGIGFETAKLVFADPFHVSIPDRIEGGEQRWQTFGLIGPHVLLVVAHTYRDENGVDVIRIISARRATRREKRKYENG